MEVIFHTLGLCPDSLSHVDIMDIFICYYGEVQSLIHLIKMRFGS
jgi:hypothetical protein